MKILFLEWKSYCVPDMAEAFTEAGHDVTLATCAEMPNLTIFLLCPRTVTRLKFFISPGFMTIH